MSVCRHNIKCIGMKLTVVNNIYIYIYITALPLAQAAGTVEYTDGISIEGYDPPPINECPGYDLKQSDNEAPALEI